MIILEENEKKKKRNKSRIQKRCPEKEEKRK